jgi:YVTN family beta-propeller protein
MKTPLSLLLLAVWAGGNASGGQAPGAATDADIPVSSQDRVYLSDQFSNTVSVVDPAAGTLLGVIRLGDLTPANLSPLYRGQLLVHGLGLSPDSTTICAVSIGSNSVTFIDTATNRVKHTSYVGRAPHEAMFTRDGTEVWVTVRGEDYVQVLDGHTYAAQDRITVPNGPGMTIFSPDGQYGYVVSSFTPMAVVIDVRTHRIIARIPQASPFSPDVAVTPDGRQLWFTLKDVGKTQVVSARPPFAPIALLETGPITNHVNFVRNGKGQFAYVSVGGKNEVQVYTTSEHPTLVATIATGHLPHGIWPSGDGSRIYVGLENGNAVTAIDTSTNTVITTIRSGQGPQGLVYVPNAVPQGSGTDNLTPLGDLGQSLHLDLAPVGAARGTPPTTTIAVDSQGLVDQLEAAVTGLQPKTAYLLALSAQADGSLPREAVASFATNPAGAAIVNAIGPLRKVVQGDAVEPRRYFVIGLLNADLKEPPAQVQRLSTGTDPLTLHENQRTIDAAAVSPSRDHGLISELRALLGSGLFVAI